MGAIRISESAESDLLAIWEYVARDKPVAAQALVDAIIEKCRLLADAPLSAPPYRTGSAIRSGFHGRYVIYYRAADDGIDILRVRSGNLDSPGIAE